MNKLPTEFPLGTRIMGMGKDGRYHPGEVCGRNEDGTIRIKFDNSSYRVSRQASQLQTMFQPPTERELKSREIEELSPLASPDSIRTDLTEEEETQVINSPRSAQPFNFESAAGGSATAAGAGAGAAAASGAAAGGASAGSSPGAAGSAANGGGAAGGVITNGVHPDAQVYEEDEEEFDAASFKARIQTSCRAIIGANSKYSSANVRVWMPKIMDMVEDTLEEMLPSQGVYKYTSHFTVMKKAGFTKQSELLVAPETDYAVHLKVKNRADVVALVIVYIFRVA